MQLKNLMSLLTKTDSQQEIIDAEIVEDDEVVEDTKDEEGE